MKSKIMLLILIVFIVNTFLIGCRNTTSIRVPDQSIPFLTLAPDNANGEIIKKAILNFWDLRNGRIIKTDKFIYTVIPTTDIKSEQAFYEDPNGDRPLYWDGKDCIILPWFFKSATNLYKRTETISEVPKVGKGLQNLTRVIFGKDVEMVRIPTGDNHDYKYTVKLWDGEKYIEKELNLNYEFQDTNSQPSYPVAIGNDETNLNILVSGGYNPQTGMDLFLCTVDKKAEPPSSEMYPLKGLFLCTVDKKDWTSKWYKISVENDAGIGPSNPPFSSNSIYFDGSFYLPSGCCGIAKVDIKECTCSVSKELKEILSYLKMNVLPAASEEEFARDISIAGSYEDILLLNISISLISGQSEYICAIRNGELLGIIHIGGEVIKNGSIMVKEKNVDVMDKTSKIISNSSFDKDVFIVFPRNTGGL